MHSAAVQNGPLSFVEIVTDTKKTNNISAPKNILKKQDCVHKISFSFFLSDPLVLSVFICTFACPSVFYSSSGI